LQGRTGLAGRPCIGAASGSLARFRTSHHHHSEAFARQGKLRNANRDESPYRRRRLPPRGLCETEAGRPSSHTETTQDHIKGKEDSFSSKRRPDQDPAKTRPKQAFTARSHPYVSNGLSGGLSTMADPRATLTLFPSPVVHPIPSHSSRGSPWQQTDACRALSCRDRGQLRSIKSTVAGFWNSSVEIDSRDTLRAEMLRLLSWCSPKTLAGGTLHGAKQGHI